MVIFSSVKQCVALVALATHLISSSAAIAASSPSSSPPSSPLVRSRAGVFQGRHLPSFAQDVFLGIPYAPQPRRFTPSTLISDAPNTTTVNAQNYGLDCPSYGSDTTALLKANITRLGEDCLRLNIIRPTLNSTKHHHHQKQNLLPVLVWIYGGGWQQGATSDPRYNMSYLVAQSMQINKPFIGISLNYRTAAFGFLYSAEVAAAKSENLGLRDQQTALRWIQRHIRDFGGDAERVTVWGESAGGYSVGDHLNSAFDSTGKEKLFRAAILESGGSVGPPLNGTAWYQPLYDRLVARAGCGEAVDTLECLREVPYEALYAVANEGLEWFHVRDGEFIKRPGQVSLKRGWFAKVPIIAGTNTDEGFGVNGVNTEEDALKQLLASKRWVLNEEQARRILELYPDGPGVGSPYGWPQRNFSEFGNMFKRYQGIATDLTMFAPRRLLVESMARYEQRVFSYRWDAPPANSTTQIGVKHFAEIPFVFGNPEQTLSPLGNSTENRQLAQLIQRMYASFVTDLTPNNHGVASIPKWPSYADRKANFVFRKDRNYIEEDNARAEGVQYINSLVR